MGYHLPSVQFSKCETDHEVVDERLLAACKEGVELWHHFAEEDQDEIVLLFLRQFFPEAELFVDQAKVTLDILSGYLPEQGDHRTRYMMWLVGLFHCQEPQFYPCNAHLEVIFELIGATRHPVDCHL